MDAKILLECLLVAKLHNCENACISCVRRNKAALLFMAAWITEQASGSSTSICQAKMSQVKPVSTAEAKAGSAVRSLLSEYLPLESRIAFAMPGMPPAMFFNTWCKWECDKLPNAMTPESTGA